MKKTRILVLMGLSLSVLLSCKKDKSEPLPPPPPPPDLTPVITGISPSSGGYNTSLTITGTHFSSTASSNTVSIGGITVPVTAATDSQLTVTVPQLLSTGGGAVVVSTSHGKDTGDHFTYSPDIYIVGREKGTDNISRPKLWINGTATSLPIGANGGEATSVFVTTTDVVVGGIEETSTSAEPRVWLNGVSSSLPHLGQGGQIRGVWLNGSNIYAAGFAYGTSGWSLARTWLNSSGTNLTSGSASDANATGIVMVGADQYVCGSEDIGGRSVARLWRNGVPTSLSNSSNNCYAVGIAVSGTDIYVVGYEMQSTGERVKVWINGVETTYSGEANLRDRPNSITVYKGDVYVAGNDESMLSGMKRPKLWKNGVANVLEPTSYGDAKAVAVCGENIYVAVAGNLSSGPRVKVYKNGTPTEITSGATDAYPSGIALR